MTDLFNLRKLRCISTCALIANLFAMSVGAETILLKNGIIHTVTGRTLEHGSVLMDGTNISGVFEGKFELNKPVDRQVELNGAHVYPGLIAMNSGLGLGEIEAIRATQDMNEVGSYTPDVKSWIAVNPDSELIPVARANGIAYAEPVPQGGVVSGLSAVIRLDGWTIEEMLVKKPVALHLNWPDATLDTTPKEKFKDATKFKSLEDQAKERHKKINELVEFFQEARAYEAIRSNPSNTYKMLLNPAWEAMLPVVRGEIPIVIYANDERQITSALDWAGTNHFKIIIAGGMNVWRMADKIASSNVPVLFEFTMLQPRREQDSYDAQFKAAETLHKAGVKLAIGVGMSGFSASQARNLPYTAAQCIAFGLPDDEALKAITIRPAEMLGVEKRLGSIEVGKEATLVVFDGDIFNIRSNVKQMWIAGKAVTLDSRHTRLYERYKNRPKRN